MFQRKNQRNKKEWQTFILLTKHHIYCATLLLVVMNKSNKIFTSSISIYLCGQKYYSHNKPPLTLFSNLYVSGQYVLIILGLK